MQRRFPIWLGVVLVLIAGVLVFNLFEQPADNQQAKEDPEQVPKTEVQTAPDFALTDLEGNSVSLGDFKGKNVYINFWASWCGPCRLEMPDIEKIHHKYNDQDLVVLAVNIGESNDTVRAYMKNNNLSFTALLDPNGSAAKTYKVSSIPLSIFINTEGVIVGKRVGLMNLEQMEAYVSELYN